MAGRTMAVAWAGCLAMVACTGGESVPNGEPVKRAEVVVQLQSPLGVGPVGMDAAVPQPAPVVVVADAGEALEQKDVGLGLTHDDVQPVDHLARARELEARGDDEGALKECRRAIFDEPTQGPAFDLLARVAGKRGDRALAAQGWEALSELRTDDPVPLVRLARARTALGDQKGAVKAAQRALALDSGLPEAHHVKGLAHLRLGQLGSAIREFRKTTELAPSHGWAFNNLGYALLRANEPEQAKDALEQAALLLPKVAAVYNNLGLAYEKTGSQDDASAAYDRALFLRPRYVKAKVNAARAQLVAQNSATVSATPPGDEPAVVVPVEPAPETVEAIEPVGEDE